jgi:putative membrane protein insertion efficiency factor
VVDAINQIEAKRGARRKNVAARDQKAASESRSPLASPAAAVKVYRYTLSPLVGFHCRHLPTCSEYADEALDRYGLWAGGWMTLARLLRCQPWGTSGIDRVPDTAPRGAHWYAPWRFGKWSWRGSTGA